MGEGYGRTTSTNAGAKSVNVCSSDSEWLESIRPPQYGSTVCRLRISLQIENLVADNQTGVLHILRNILAAQRL